MTPTVADQQVNRGATATLSAELYDQDGEAFNADDATVEVVRADGTEVLPAGTPTTNTDGTYTVELPAGATNTLDVLEATWSAASAQRTTTIEVVGGFYATVAQIRASDDSLVDVTKYPPAAVRHARRVVEAEFEGITGRAFVPRFRRVDAGRTGWVTLVLPDVDLAEVLAVETVDGDGTATPYDGAIVIDPAGLIARADGTAWPWSASTVVSYVHGFPAPPVDVLGAFFLRVRDVLNRNRRGVPDRASTFTAAEGGTYSLITPGQRGSSTGIPDVDVALGRYTFESPGVA